MLRIRWPAVAAVAVLLLPLLPSPQAHAKGLSIGGNTKKFPPYPKNAVLNVFIQPDPDGLGRDTFLKEGVERWVSLLSERMRTLNVTIGNPPAGVKNPIHYKWAADGSMLSNGTQIGPGTNDAAAIPKTSPDGKQLAGGTAFVRRGLTAPTDDNKKNLLRNVGEHELVHLLGLGDDPDGAVHHHVQTPGVRGHNDEDLKELNSLYGTKTSGGAKTPKGGATKTGGGGGMGFFQYRFDLLPANLVSDPADPEHVALITLGIDPKFVTGLTLPPGWVGLAATGPVAMSDPFFSEGYMIDGATDPPPWAPGPHPTHLILRTSAAQAALDGVPAGVDPGLTLGNSSVTVGVSLRSGMSEGPIPVWAGGDFQTVTGPVPEPATVLLFGTGLLGLLGFSRRSRP